MGIVGEINADGLGFIKRKGYISILIDIKIDYNYINNAY